LRDSLSIKSSLGIDRDSGQERTERIAKCLQALAAQHQAPPYQIVLLLNNCTDTTGPVVNALAQQLPVPIHSVKSNLPGRLAHASYARHLAMEAAAQLAAPKGILLTTDADIWHSRINRQ
jgi:hypothetical protein